MILGIETSCDETAAAVVAQDGRLLSNVVSSQAELHAPYGGVVPEVASRHHLELILPAVRQALAEADADLGDAETIAVTQGPGLVGALLVGISAAKALAWSRRVPLVPVNHLHGHVASLFLRSDPVTGSQGGAGSDPGAPSDHVEASDPNGASGLEAGSDPLEPPFVCLLASGGHTLLLDVRDHGVFEVVGTTIDDAAGEAFDKGARLLGLGYPGGVEIDRLAREGDPEAFSFPVARVPGFDFSFSGLKTALLYTVRELGDGAESSKSDLAASYQRAIVRALVERTRAAADALGAQRIAIVGGVAANSELRAALPEATAAPLPLCTDNAAMIASAARYADPIPYPRYLALDAFA